tara:strand:- start:1461 stop:1853 length:393 start_codon:yes stop_codon:yes gene_type:complete
MNQHSIWDVKAREKVEEDRIRATIKGLEGGIAVVKASVAMRTSSGYAAFVGAVTSLRDISRSSLVADNTLTDAGLRESRGRVRALNEVLGLLESDKASAELEGRLQVAQNELDAVLHQRPGNPDLDKDQS